MARIRTIKPEFWRDDDLSEVSPEAALLAIGLLNVADDEGFFNANHKLIEADIFPLRELSRTVTVLMQELESIGYIVLYSSKTNRKYGHVVNFKTHQVINKPKPSKIKDLCSDVCSYRSDTVQLPVGKEQGKEQGKEGNIVVSDDNDEIEQARTYTFNEFYTAYPVKKSKKAAIKAWNTMEDKDQILAVDRLGHFITTVPQGINFPHPSTYLNQSRWTDEKAESGNRELPSDAKSAVGYTSRLKGRHSCNQAASQH